MMAENETKAPALTEQRKSYSPAETALVKCQTIQQIVDAQSHMLDRAPEKTNLNDLAAVQRVASECMRKCADIGCLPNFEMLAAQLGYSRRGLYDFVERHGKTESAEYIDRLRTAWASMRQMAADRGAVSDTMSIFVLLNSSLGFTNQHTVEIQQPKGPLDDLDAEAARERILASIPEPDEW